MQAKHEAGPTRQCEYLPGAAVSHCGHYLKNACRLNRSRICNSTGVKRIGGRITTSNAAELRCRKPGYLRVGLFLFESRNDCAVDRLLDFQTIRLRGSAGSG